MASQSNAPNALQRSLSWMHRTAFEHALKRRDDDFRWLAPNVWHAEARTGSFNFFDRDAALRWLEQNNEPAKNTFEVQATYIKPSLFQWLSKQHEKGMHVDVVQTLNRAHCDSIDDAIAWFNRLPAPKAGAAFELLRLGLVSDRPDATHAVASYLHSNPEQWFSPAKMWHNALQGFGGNEKSELCLFARCCYSVSITKWFFQHQPSFKMMFLEEPMWDLLQEGLSKSNNTTLVAWPAVAYHVFSRNVDPLLYDDNALIQYGRELERSFAHSPAAQCYFLYHRFVHCPESYRRVFENTTQSMDENVQMFYQQLQALYDKTEPPVTNSPHVDNMMLGVHLGLEPGDFYLHTKKMFDGQPPEDEIAVDAQLWASA